MSLSLPSLSDVSAAEVDQAQSLINQLLKDFSSDIDTRRGAIGDVVVFLSALLHSSEVQLIDMIRRSSSLSEIAADPNLAEPDIVDAVLSNYLVTRRDGTKASGKVRVLRDTNTDLTVPAGTVLLTGGVAFETIDTYQIKSSGSSALTTTDLVQTLLSSGSYAVLLPVRAIEVGSNANVARNSVFTFDDFDDESVVSLKAATDFTGGTSEETNSDLLLRAQEGISVKTAVTRSGARALLRQIETLENLVDVYLVGYGDQEQRRYHSILPVSFGGRIDAWLRGEGAATELTLTKTATLMAKTATGGLWQVVLDVDDAPGFYDITKIVPEGENGTGYDIYSETRGYDISSADPVPDISTAAEAAYSRWQTAAVQFIDTAYDVTNLVVGSATKDYDITVRYMPGIDEGQTLLSDPELDSQGADVLLKAAVPCFVEISFVINKKTYEEDPDTDAIKEDLASIINNLGFVPSLAGSTVLHTIHKHLIGTQTVSGLDMYCSIRRPDGTIKTARSAESLTIPDEPTYMLSEKTASFFLQTSDVGITITAS